MIDRRLRIENLWVVALLLVAVLVGLGARWRDDPRHAGVARAINLSIRVSVAAVVTAIVAFLGLALLVGPIGNP
jgi:hypothetical protein